MNQAPTGDLTGPNGQPPAQAGIRCTRYPQGCPNFLEPDDQHICKPCRYGQATTTVPTAAFNALMDVMKQQNETNRQAQIAAARNFDQPALRIEGQRDRSRSPIQEDRRRDRERPPHPPRAPALLRTPARQRRTGRAAVERQNPEVMNMRPCPWCLSRGGNAHSHRLGECNLYNAANQNTRGRFIMNIVHGLQRGRRERDDPARQDMAGQVRAVEARPRDQRARQTRLSEVQGTGEDTAGSGESAGKSDQISAQDEAEKKKNERKKDEGKKE